MDATTQVIQALVLQTGLVWYCLSIPVSLYLPRALR